MENIEFKILDKSCVDQMVPLTQQLNPHTSLEDLSHMQKRMFDFNNYHCFGIFSGDKLVGLSSGWITIKLYSGKQIEIDNVIVDSTIQSKGYGKFMIDQIEEWAIKNGCNTIELNTYVQNSRSHKFYFQNGYKIVGYHFQKEIG